MGTLNFIVVLACASPICAQDRLPPGRLLPVTTMRDAGILHLATNTWTRKAASAALGADTIYDNTCTSGYFSPLSTDTYVDEGGLRGPGSGGCATSYRVDGFQISYCTDQPVPGPFVVSFYESYAPCATVVGVTPSGSFTLAGLPGGSVGIASCWIVTIDLGAQPGGSAMSFSMQAQGGPQGHFGWAFRSTAPASQQNNTGPVIAGNPAVCPVGSGTGFLTLDQFRIEGGPTAPGCYYFGGVPFASFHLELYADACPPQSAGVDFCTGDGSGTPCPCGNNSNPGENGGCLNSLGQSGRLRADGVPRLSNDTLRLFTAGIAPTAQQLFFQGTLRRNNGLGLVMGDGLACAGGTLTRLGTRPADANGTAMLPSGGSPALSIAGGVTSPGVRTYQSWYRNAASFCTSATFNLTNGWEVTWAP